MWPLAPFAGVPDWFLLGLLLGAAFTVIVATAFLVGELLVDDSTTGSDGDHVDGERLRNERIRRYLEAIDERYVEGHGIEGHDVAFFLPDRGVAVTFDPRAFFALADTDVRAILCEDEMPAEHLGSRLPFETPSSGLQSERSSKIRSERFSGVGAERSSETRSERFAAGHPGSSSGVPSAPEWAFRELGVSPTVETQRIRSAYRKRVKDVHPDHGGDEEAFMRLQEAYLRAKEHAERAS